MDTHCIDTRSGCKWKSHVIVEASNFEEAKAAAILCCERGNRVHENIKEQFIGTGHQMTLGGGCRW